MSGTKVEISTITTPKIAHSALQFWALFFALCLAVLCQAWYGSGYLLTACAFQLSYGKIYNLYPIKWVFLIALALFEIGSLICGAAPSSVGLIMGRVVAGIGSGGLFSGAILLVAEFKPLNERAFYNGMLGAMYSVASVAGPLMGGAFTERVTWRLCFYINLPLGVVTAVIVFLLVPNNYDPGRDSRRGLPLKKKLQEMDLYGLVVLVPTIICILLATQWGGTKYSWSNARIIALFVVGFVLFVAFVVIEIWQGDRAIVPPSLVKRRTVWACSIFSFCLFGSFLVVAYFLPLWFQAIKGDTATESGIHNLPSILGTTIFSVAAGGMVFGLGYYTWACILGSVLAAVGAGLLSTLEVDSNAAKWIGYQVLYGAGCGFGLNQPLIAIQAALPDFQKSEGTAVVIFMQTFGGTIAIAVAQNVFNNKLVSNILAAGIPVDPAALLSVGATKLQGLVQPQFFGRLQLAYNDSITQTFYVAVATAGLSMAGSILIPWLSVKQAVAPEDAETANTIMPFQHPSSDVDLAMPAILRQSGKIASEDSQSSDIEKVPRNNEVSTYDSQTSEVEKSSVGSTNRKVESIQN
ncbi:MFS-type efflux pump elcC [Parastagonospora nodorum]|nr:MFS-type efflux pump elcC [Parastagonospora nodorum]KAH4183358.1 MFS-type efflux pump elcC [Parastagonospora nodorum]KAH5035136.1 MFS-type efflux pump elcC [Parastagonospora nodorum]KAH5080137.1 MFS-type efflux pump elcC [Parastagonospora nodorum]KAH5092094.1 MFS-type efflux pump elcC [Parastagonospora nodorum]